MKRNPKKHILLKFIAALFLVFAALVINSCKKDNNNNKITPKLDQAVEQAKSWYETTYPASNGNSGKLITQSAGGTFDLSRHFKPDWQHSQKYKRGNKDVIELPIDPGSKYNAALRDKATNKIPYNKDYSRSYFLFLNDGKKYIAYVMTVIADDSYVKGDTSKLKNNTYQHNDADFTGLVLYFTPKGKYVQGYAYKNGQPVSPSTSVTQGTQKTQSLSDSRLKPQDMVVVCIDWYWQTYADGVLIDEEYLYTTCSGGGSGSGSGGGGTTPPSTPCNTPPINQTSVSGSHLTVNSTINQPRLNFIPPPTDPGDPCDPTIPPNPTTPDQKSPNFGEPGTGVNRIIDDSNFDNMLDYLENNGYSFSDPGDVQVVVNGVTYTGQLTNVYDSSGNVIARFFSPDVTSPAFHLGMEYSIDIDHPSNPMYITIFGNTLGQYPSVTITHTGGGSGSTTSGIEIFSNINTPVNAPDIAVIDLGIGMTNISATAAINGLRLIGKTQDRRPPPPELAEDMTYGTNGDVTGINVTQLNLSDANLFAGMTSLFQGFTALDASGLGVVGTNMIAKFRANTGGQFSDAVLNGRVASSAEYKNFIQKFGSQLNQQLQLKGGDLSKITTLTATTHPIFNGIYNKFHGLQILIDDTEYTEIKIANYIYVNGHWSATLDITIHDDFGLDRNDAIHYQSYSYGFADWWLLQHKRGYKPFETIVHLRASITAAFQINPE